MSHSIKVVVANNSRYIDFHDSERGWVTVAVESPNGLANGVYPLNEAAQIQRDSSLNYAGIIIHVDCEFAYQSTSGGNRLVKHELDAFRQPPRVGQRLALRYEHGKVLATPHNSLSSPHSFHNLPSLG